MLLDLPHRYQGIHKPCGLDVDQEGGSFHLSFSKDPRTSTRDDKLYNTKKGESKEIQNMCFFKSVNLVYGFPLFSETIGTLIDRSHRSHINLIK